MSVRRAFDVSAKGLRCRCEALSRVGAILLTLVGARVLTRVGAIAVTRVAAGLGARFRRRLGFDVSAIRPVVGRAIQVGDEPCAFKLRANAGLLVSLSVSTRSSSASFHTVSSEK